MTSSLLNRVEKLYDNEKYQEAIDLLLDNPSKKDKQNPDYWLILGSCYFLESSNENIEKAIQPLKKGIKLLNSYEDNPEAVGTLENIITSNRSTLVVCYAKMGLNKIGEPHNKINNEAKEIVESCRDYILNHVDDCSNIDAFDNAGRFLLVVWFAGYLDKNGLDTLINLYKKSSEMDGYTDDDFAWCKMSLLIAYAIKGHECIEEGDFENTYECVENILASNYNMSDEKFLIVNIVIGTFLADCHRYRNLMSLNDDTFSIASRYLNECLNSDRVHIQNSANFGLGLLNLENYNIAWGYFSKIPKDEKQTKDLVSYFRAINNFPGQPKEQIKILLTLKESKFVSHTMILMYLSKAYFEDQRKAEGLKLLKSLSRSDFKGRLITGLPLYDLICYLYLKQEDALDNLKGWTQKYPDSELIKEYLDIAEKSTIENDEFIDFKLINIPINWNYIINRSDLTDEITTESLQIPKSLLRSKLKSKPFQLSGGFKIDNKTNIYSLISLVPRENFRIALIGKKHKNIIQLKRIRDNTVVTDYITDEFFSFLRILYEERKTKKNDYRIYLTDEPSELIKYFLKDTYGNRMFMWINSKAQKSTLVNRINNLFPNLIITEYGNNSEQYYILDHGISTDH